MTAVNDKTRELQRTLYRAAKADPERRFHALYDKVHRRDVLERAWKEVRRNRGAAGIDRQTIEAIEEGGEGRFLDDLESELKDGSYRCSASRRVFIEKPGSTEKRPLSIPTVRDRIVQAAVKLAIEPIFEAAFSECSFGFRPGRSTRDALQVLIDEAWRGNRWVVETDIASCFEEIPQDRLMVAIEERICDRYLLKLLRAMLRAGVMADGELRRNVAGTPQGGVVSPLLANVYLDRIDWRWQARGKGVLVRYADDLVVMCRTQEEARSALGALRAILADLGLRPKQAKTRIVHLREGGEGLDFLGFHHRWVRGNSERSRHLRFLVRWPSQAAMTRARERVREITARKRLLLPVEQVVGELNMFLRGWAGYFRYGNSAAKLDWISRYAAERLVRFIAARHDRSLGYGWSVFHHQSADRMGLIPLHGIVIAPRPTRRVGR